MVNEGATKKRILVVDDDPNISRLLAESLRLLGYDVSSFSAAEDVTEKLDNCSYDLALLDILLPGTNGLQLCRTLRRHPASCDIPVIMMTAFYKQADHIQEAREEYGCTDYLLKPFPLKSLHEKIEQLIGPPSGTPTAERLSIQGELTETPLAQILHNLYSLRATGLLHFEKGDVKKVVYIRNGYPIFVRSNLVREFLGQMLVSKGIISQDELDTSLQVAKEQGKRHGEVLLEMGLITTHQLDEILRAQVLEKLLDIFSWEGGCYRFTQAREFKQGVTSIDISPANLILQGLRDHAERNNVLKMLDPHLDLYLTPAENPLYRFQEIQLSPVESRIFNQCKGHYTLRELLKRHQLSRRQAEPLLAALLCTGILVPRKEKVAGTSEIPGDEPIELKNRREVFLKDYTWMMQQDYFTLLGVSEVDNKEQIRKSYYNLVKKYHPDRFFEEDLLLDLKEKVNALFQRISDAHETLVDPTQKARYINDLKGKSSKPKADLETILQAETAFQKGIVLFRVKKYGEALESFNLALELGPTEAEYLMYQAWSSYKHTPKDVVNTEKVRQNLMRAIEINPKLAMAHLYLGYICKDEGNAKEAKRRFERALQSDADCTDAQRELRLMNMRKERADKNKKGLLGKMFRK